MFRFLNSSIILIVSFLFLLCTWSVPVFAADEIHIGVLQPLTGGASSVGQKFKMAYQFGADEINANGGIASMGGAKIKLIFGDTESKPEVGISETERLINREKVVALIGAFQSSVTLPTTQIAERYGIPYLVPNSTANAISERGFKATFRIGQKAEWYPQYQLGFIVDAGEKTGQKVSTIGLLYEDTEWGVTNGKGWRKWIEENGPKHGMEMVADLAYSHGAADLTPVIAKLKAAKPDLVLAASYTPDAILISKTMSSLKFSPKLAFMGTAAGHSDTAFIAGVGPLAENALTFAGWSADLNKPGVQEFHDKLVAEIGSENFVWMQAYCYSAMYVLKDALERAGAADHNKIREALAKTDITTGPAVLLPLPDGKISFDQNGQLKTTAVVNQIQNGKFVSVWPFDIAASQLTWPAISNQ